MDTRFAVGTLAAILVYFAPAIIATAARHLHHVRILILNVFIGPLFGALALFPGGVYAAAALLIVAWLALVIMALIPARTPRNWGPPRPGGTWPHLERLEPCPACHAHIPTSAFDCPQCAAQLGEHWAPPARPQLVR